MTGELDIAREAVAIGAKLLASAERGTVHRKGDRDTVTDLDLRIQDEVRRFLAIEAPETAFLGEERGGGDIPAAEDVWVLDPIDGTANFTHGLPMCAVSLALLRDRKPVVAAVTTPFLGRTYHAESGGGAFCDGHRIRVSGVDDLSAAIVSLGDYAVGANAEAKNRQRFAVTMALAERVERVRMVGSAALDLAWVAEGRLDACVILANKPWDTAAGVLLAREAGAVVTDASGEHHTVDSRQTVATTPSIAAAVLDLLRRCQSR